MKGNDILKRLENAKYKWAEASHINEEIQKLSLEEKRKIRIELTESPILIKEADNRDFLDVVDHIIRTLEK